MGRSVGGPGAFATLKPALLARKGAARPAMRQQLAALEAVYGAIPGTGLDDLGWNDFGPETDGANRVVPINGGAAARRAAKPARKAPAETGAETSAEIGRKAAFTLRLDPERHRRLRLACALDARSAQALVIDALDRLLAAMPELEPLTRDAGTLSRAKPRAAKA